MGEIYKKSDYVNGLVRIKPEGWIDELVFETNGLHSSGQARAGVGIRINDEGGGVLTIDDLITILQVIDNHFQKLNGEIGRVRESTKETSDE